ARAPTASNGWVSSRSLPGVLRPATWAAASAAIGVMERALATAPMRTEGRRVEVCMGLQTRTSARGSTGLDPGSPACPLPPGMKTADFDFDLPDDRIALRPAEPRDSARLLVVRDGALEDRTVRDLPDFLR